MIVKNKQERNTIMKPKGIRFTMPLSRYAPHGSGILPASLRVTLRQNGSYVLGDASTYVDILSNSSLTYKGNLIQVAAELSTEMAAATNNDAVGITAIFVFEVVT